MHRADADGIETIAEPALAYAGDFHAAGTLAGEPLALCCQFSVRADGGDAVMLVRAVNGDRAVPIRLPDAVEPLIEGFRRLRETA